jgi:site-specific DNA recombinase
MFNISLLIALYARLSKDRSGESENVFIQLAEGTDFVEDNGGTVSRKFKDNDIGASNYSKKLRKDYERLVAAVKAGEVHIIVVTEMTRLYRRLEELLQLIKLAETTPLRGIWTTDGVGYDLSTPEGTHAAIAAVNNAMLESAKISKRTKRKQRARALMGKHHGGVRSYCYEAPLKDEHGNLLNRDRVNTALVKHEVAVFRDNVARLIKGERTMWIVRDLNERGIRAAAGGKWTVGNFQRLMIKKRYVTFDPTGHPKECPCLENDEGNGTLVYNSEEHRATWPAVISPEEHTLMVARFKENTQPWAHGPVAGRSYLLTGLIYCGVCGALAKGKGRFQSPGKYQRRYGCHSTNNAGERVSCGKVFRGSDPVDTLVIEAVLERFDSPEVARALAEPEGDPEELDQLVKTLTHLQEHRKNLVLEYGRGEHSKTDYRAMLQAADASIEEIHTNVRKLQSSQTTSLLTGVQTVREAWQDATLDWQRNVIKLLVEKVVIHPCQQPKRNWRGWRFDPDFVEIVWHQ